MLQLQYRVVYVGDHLLVRDPWQVESCGVRLRHMRHVLTTLLRGHAGYSRSMRCAYLPLSGSCPTVLTAKSKFPCGRRVITARRMFLQASSFEARDRLKSWQRCLKAPVRSPLQRCMQSTLASESSCRRRGFTLLQ